MVCKITLFRDSGNRTVNRSSSSMGLLVTSVQITMGGLTLGNNPPNSPTTGVAISIFLKWTMSHINGITIHKRLTMLINLKEAKNLFMDQGWTTQTPSRPMWEWHRYQVRFTNWLQSSGTFSTMTGNPMLRSLRSLKIRAMT